MNRIATVVAGLSLAFVGTSATIAGTINVPGDQPTIAAAISASVNGDVINIAAGTYNEHSLNPGGKAITIQGTLNGDGSLATTIDPQHGLFEHGPVFICNSHEDDGTAIQNLIITGGRTDYGGGIYLDQTGPTISGCTITGNTASWDGGGIYCWSGNPTITGCTISSNTATLGGGGIACNDNTPTITGCTISGNTAAYGGGIDCSTNSDPIISGCTITGNTATSNGGGIDCGNHSNPIISDCTITGNTADQDGGGIFVFATGSTGYSNITLRTHSTISGNTPDNIVGASAAGLRGETGPSVITLENSTICGTGEHIKGVLIEHRGENHISDCIDEGDLNGDGDVDANDLDSLHASLGICPHDIDHDGETDVEDLLRFLDGYGTTCP